MIIFLSRMGYLNRIMKDTKDMAEGRLNRDVKVKGSLHLQVMRKTLTIYEKVFVRPCMSRRKVSV